jgi:hypothetical protein
MTDEKPLHVLVAEALGCSPVWGHGWLSERPGEETWLCRCEERDHGWDSQAQGCGVILRYDTDWSATGPLVERYTIHLAKWNAATGGRAWWYAAVWGPGEFGDERKVESTGQETPLLAVCALLLALKAAGKLNP